MFIRPCASVSTKIPKTCDHVDFKPGTLLIFDSVTFAVVDWDFSGFYML